ncbi:lysylphosphatidylglycerol synthase transmembrane domain-containing protein [Nocardioides sp. CER19]|uniref:lysylphosphatidylglycerol synthase transmembrane domain-containing protein n=1 Tax=Nocardioides sp. CER19 TaxID=3038538 RepID=UPI002448EE5F|nr:lysylphosphatidylglycerol synthase transmembrane domain-containing protein [Nocardioides sp. CER19]MDH2416868.1 lysylphosphatidylglycerol synthase transmembrane domain-containing protein [Nocardioides sp. CER19]
MSTGAWLKPAAGALVVGVLLARFGADPVVRGLRTADGPLLAIALALTAAATACCAWRWRAVATALDARIGFGPAYVSIYGAQFLNATLPAGVLGDVHRAVEHGRRVDSTGRAVRSVFWERTLGLAVQAAVTVAVVVLVPSGLRTAAVVVGLGAVALALVGLRWARRDVAAILRRPRVALIVVATSLGVAACHTAVLLTAMAAAGVDLPAGQALALALAVLLGSTVPTSLAGWGPREGAAAWAFMAVGLPASDGLAVSVAYGVAALVATLPGALVLLVGRLAPRREATVG